MKIQSTEPTNASLLTTEQVTAIKNKIANDRLSLSDSLKSLYPNFPRTTESLSSVYSVVTSAFPSVAAELDIIDFDAQISSRETRSRNVQAAKGITPNVFYNEIGWRNLNPTRSKFNVLKQEILNSLSFDLETARLRKLKRDLEISLGR